MKAIVFIIGTLLMLASPVYAQKSLELPTPGERKAADIASWATVGATVGWDIYRSWNCSPSRAECLARTAAKDLSAYYLSEAIKKLTKEGRPEPGSYSGYSFPSQHAALAAASQDLCGGKGARFQVALTVGTSAGRVLGGAHNWWDVLAGAGIGSLLDMFFKSC